MNPDLAERILRLARELRETADAGEHPGACVRAAQRAHDTADALHVHGRCDDAIYTRLASVLGCLKDACQVYAVDPERCSAVSLPCESRRLERLVKTAELSLETVEV